MAAIGLLSPVAHLPMWPNKCWLEEDNHLLPHTSSAPVSAAQEAAVHHCCQVILLAAVQITVPRSQGAFCRAALWPGSPWSVSLQGLLSSQMQDLVFALVEFHKVPVVLFLQPVSDPLNGNPTPEYIDWSPPAWCHLQTWWEHTLPPLPGHW